MKKFGFNNNAELRAKIRDLEDFVGMNEKSKSPAVIAAKQELAQYKSELAATTKVLPASKASLGFSFNAIPEELDLQKEAEKLLIRESDGTVIHVNKVSGLPKLRHLIVAPKNHARCMTPYKNWRECKLQKDLPIFREK